VQGNELALGSYFENRATAKVVTEFKVAPQGGDAVQIPISALDQRSILRNTAIGAVKVYKRGEGLASGPETLSRRKTEMLRTQSSKQREKGVLQVSSLEASVARDRKSH